MEVSKIVSEYKEKELDRVLFSANFKQLGLDLIDVADIVLAVEKEYSITIPETEHIGSVDDLVTCICANALPKAV
ncbi:phosphopantetheine-binding protein [Pontibacter ummariensis]|nr:phosphopantetheine-binding protein [Pontibacter ummariensis]